MRGALLRRRREWQQLPGAGFFLFPRERRLVFGKAKGEGLLFFFQREGGDQLVSGARKIKPGSSSGSKKNENQRWGAVHREEKSLVGSGGWV